MDRYLPPTNENWQGRHDEPLRQRIYQAIKLVDLKDNPVLPQGAVAFVGFACDKGIIRNHGRPGAAEGPKTIRQALAKLPLPKANLTILDVGDVICPDDDLESAQSTLATIVTRLLRLDARPIILGGGHETAWGHYQGIKNAGKHKNLKTINFDAHYDLRPLVDNKYGSSGTSFLQIAHDRKQENLSFDYLCVGIQTTGNTSALHETAQALQVKTISAETIYMSTPEELLNLFKNAIAGNKKIHLSICMDVFASAYAPGVSAPQPLGLTPWQVIPLLKHLVNQNRILSIEIAEVSPSLDFQQNTSRLAANIIYYLIYS